jgi:hypothetical protein
MNTTKLWIVSALMILLFPLGVRAQEGSEKAAADVRQELVELKQLVSAVSARLDKMEQRLSRLEEQVGRKVEPATRMRPLGSSLMVDEHGVIWDGPRPVGVWGVNGDHTAREVR